MQCGPRCCRWPISNSQPWFYCGSPTDGETAYCETHREQRRASPEPVDQQARRFINMYGRIK